MSKRVTIMIDDDLDKKIRFQIRFEQEPISPTLIIPLKEIGPFSL